MLAIRYSQDLPSNNEATANGMSFIVHALSFKRRRVSSPSLETSGVSCYGTPSHRMGNQVSVGLLDIYMENIYYNIISSEKRYERFV